MATKKPTKKATPAKPKADPFDMGFLPVESLTLTPKAAEEWLESDAKGWHQFLDFALRLANSEERVALGQLAYWIGQMVEACAAAVRRDRASWGEAEELSLVLCAALREGDRDGMDCNLFQPELSALASALVKRTREGKAEMQKQWKAEQKQRHEEKLATDPAYRAREEAREEAIARSRAAEAAAAGRAAVAGA